MRPQERFRRVAVGAILQKRRGDRQNCVPHLQFPRLIFLTVGIRQDMETNHAVVNLCFSVNREQTDHQQNRHQNQHDHNDFFLHKKQTSHMF